MTAVDRTSVPFIRSLQAKLLLGLAVILVAMLSAMLLVLYARGYELLLTRERELAKRAVEQVASEMSRELAVAEGLAVALENLGESLPKDESLWRQVVPMLIDSDGRGDLIAGGGLWPEPYTFDPSIERRSFFWGRDSDGVLRYYDDYNKVSGPGYHQEEWYVPGRHLPAGRCYWSRSYRDPYSNEPMVTCTAAMIGQGRFLGVSTVDLKLSGLQRFLDRHGRELGGYAFAVDRNGVLITIPWLDRAADHPDIPKVVDRLADHAGKQPAFGELANFVEQPFTETRNAQVLALAQKIDAATPAIERIEAERIAEQLLEPDRQDPLIRQTSLPKDPLLGEDALVTSLRVPGSHWQLVVVQPERVVRESVLSVIRRVGSALVLAIVVVVFLAGWMLRRGLVQPIQSLARQLSGQAGAAEGQHVQVEGDDEIGVLARQINLYADRISETAEAAEAAAEQFRAVSELAHDALIQVDDGGRIVRVNQSGQAIFGWTDQELCGQPIASILPWDPRADAGALAAATGNGSRAASQVRELTAIRRDHSTFPAEVSVSYWRGPRHGLYNIQIRDVTERRRNEEQVRVLATHDSLTGLPNRALFNDRLKRAVERCQIESSQMALLFLDLDHFKVANDSLGHEVGDLLLRAVADRLARCIRRGDTVARIGGDEFAMLLPNIDDPAEAAAVAQQAIDALAQPFEIEGQIVQIGVSIGVALCPDDDQIADQLLRKVDLAMYHAKAEGRNTFRFFTARLHLALLERKTLLDELSHAIQREEFELHYQPVIDAATQQVHGLEALLRWRHPTLGLVMPDRFVPLAEQSGLIVAIGHWVITRAIAEIVEWERVNGHRIRLAINLSLAQFKDAALIERVHTVLNRHGFDPTRLEFELTETVLMHDHEEAALIMKRLRGLGIGLAVDDFGTGYSSLSYLKRFPVQKLKIDKSFVSGASDDEDSAAICRSVIALGHNLGMRIVGEGVESEQDLRFLRVYRCEFVQGFYFSEAKPIGELDLSPWL